MMNDSYIFIVAANVCGYKQFHWSLVCLTLTDGRANVTSLTVTGPHYKSCTPAN